jgi:hypothetical protein
MSSVDVRDVPSGRARRWLAGLVIGAAGAILLVLGGVLGVAAMAFLGLALVARRDGRAGLAGLPVGFGSVILALLLRAESACQPGECASPDVTGWVALATGCLVAGALATIALMAQPRAG